MDNAKNSDIDKAYLNKSLADMLGEVWKNIPGFEGSYQASSLGQMKSLDRIIPHPRIGRQTIKGRILSQSLHENTNIAIGEPMIDLRISLNLENVQYYFNTRRVMYLTFTDPKLSYKENALYITIRIAMGNNRPEDLALATKSEKQLRAIKRERVLPYLGTADRSG